MNLSAMLGEVLQSLFRRPNTERYPVDQQPVTARLRGALHWNPEKCTGCALCVKDCPSEAIELITLDKASKRFVLRYHADRCTFCAQCVQNCRFKCLEMSPTEWELASTTKPPFTVYYGDEKDVQTILDRNPPSKTTPLASG